MPVEFSDLVRIAGITLLLTVLWGSSVAAAWWDTHHRDLTPRATFAWLAVVALLPIAGFILYLIFRAAALLFHSKGRVEGPMKRDTALKEPRSRRRSMPTLMASDLGLQTVASPVEMLPVQPAQASARHSYRFSVTAGPDQNKEFIISDLPANIGRGFEAAVRLDGDLGVSRQHAEIYERDGILHIRDLKSTHGTQVNGVVIDDARLDMGSRIQVGLSILGIALVEE